LLDECSTVVRAPNTDTTTCFGMEFCAPQVPLSNLHVGVSLWHLFDFTSHFIHISSFNTDLCTHMNAGDVSLRLYDAGLGAQ
jgi:hypothetical protein